MEFQGQSRAFHDLIMKTSPGERMRLQKMVPDFFLYGASEDLSILYFENEAGRLFFTR